MNGGNFGTLFHPCVEFVVIRLTFFARSEAAKEDKGSDDWEGSQSAHGCLSPKHEGVGAVARVPSAGHKSEKSWFSSYVRSVLQSSAK